MASQGQGNSTNGGAAQVVASAPKPFVSPASISIFKAAIASGQDIGRAIDILVTAEVREAVAKGVPKAAAEKAAALFVGELSANLNAKQPLNDAIADAEHVFTGAVKQFLLAPGQNGLLETLSAGGDIGQLLGNSGLTEGEAARALGEALQRGESTERAVDKAKIASQALAKADTVKAANQLLDALSKGEGIDQLAGSLAQDSTFGERFAEAIQKGQDLKSALSMAQEAASSARTAHLAADASSKGGALAALATGMNVNEAVGSPAFMQALAAAGATPAPAPAPGGAGGGSLMEALASGLNLNQSLSGGGAAFDQALGRALAGGAGLQVAMAQASFAQSVSPPQGGGNPLMEALATGQGAGLGGAGGGTFDAALGEALSRGASPDQALGEASSRANIANHANASVGGGPAGQGGGSTAPVSAPVSQPAPSFSPSPAPSPTGTPSPAPGPVAPPAPTFSPAPVTTASPAPSPFAPVAPGISPQPTVLGQPVTTFAPPPPPPPPPPTTTSSNNNNPPPPPPPPPPAAVNHAPTAANATLTLNEDTSRVFALSDFGYTDADNHTLSSVRLESHSGAGTLEHKVGAVWSAVNLGGGAQTFTATDINAGNLRFAPAANANGNGYGGFSFKVSDGSLLSATANTLSMNVTAVNDAPTGDNATLTMNENTSRVFALSDFGYADVESSPMSEVLVNWNGSNGSLEQRTMGVWSTVNTSIPVILPASGISNGDYRFTPAASANGNGYASILFAVTDGTAPSANPYTFTVNVAAVNDAPTIGLSSTSPALSFNGTSSAGIVTPTGGALSGASMSAITMEAWVKPTSVSYNPFLEFAGNGGAAFGAHLWNWDGSGTNSTGRLFTNLIGSNNAEHWFYSAANILQAGVWQHVAITYDRADGVATLYKDGVAVVSSNLGAYDVDTAGNFNIGYRNDVNFHPLAGSIDEARVWNVRRTAAELQTGMYNDVTGANGLVGRWGMNEGAGSSAAGIGGANNAALTNATWETRSFTPSYVEQNTALAFLPSVTLTDIDSSTFSGATLTISSGLTSGDVLNFTNQNGITGSWNAGTGVLTLSGTASLANYDTALESVTFSSTSDGPTAISASRTVSLVVNDGAGTSNLSAAATATINVTPVSDVSNQAIDLDGVDDVATVSGIALNDGTSNNNASFSWEFWSYHDTAAQNDYILSQGATGTDTNLHIGYSANTTFTFAFYGDDLNYTEASSSAGNWVHWAGTYDGVSNQRILYKNGAQVATDTATGDYYGTGTLNVGNYSIGNLHYFDGKLDEVRIWSDVRTSTEIQTNMSRQLAGNETNLLAYWRLDEGTGTSASDLATGNGAQNLTFSGTPAWSNLGSLTAANNATVSTHLLAGSGTAAGQPAFTLVGGTSLEGSSDSINATTGVLSYTSGNTDGSEHLGYQIAAGGTTYSDTFDITVT